MTKTIFEPGGNPIEGKGLSSRGSFGGRSLGRGGNGMLTNTVCGMPPAAAPIVFIPGIPAQT